MLRRWAGEIQEKSGGKKKSLHLWSIEEDFAGFREVWIGNQSLIDSDVCPPISVSLTSEGLQLGGAVGWFWLADSGGTEVH